MNPPPTAPATRSRAAQGGPGRTGPAAPPRDDMFGVPGIGRAIAVGAATAFVVVVALVGLLVALTDTPRAVVLAGAFAATFGGLGFGGMLGAVSQVLRHERSAA